MSGADKPKTPVVGERYRLSETGLRAEVEILACSVEAGLVTMSVVVCESRHNTGSLAPEPGERFDLAYRLGCEGMVFGLQLISEHEAEEKRELARRAARERRRAKGESR